MRQSFLGRRLHFVVLRVALSSAVSANACDETVSLTVEGFREKDHTLLLGVVSEFQDETGAMKSTPMLVEATLGKAALPQRVPWSWPELSAPAVREESVRAMRTKVNELTSKGAFEPLVVTLVTAPERLLRKRPVTVHEKQFVDPRGSGWFVVRRFMPPSQKAHFELSYQMRGSKEESVLQRSLLSGINENPVGVEVTESLFLLGEFVVGLTRYCGQAYLWSHRLDNALSVDAGVR